MVGLCVAGQEQPRFRRYLLGVGVRSLLPVKKKLSFLMQTTCGYSLLPVMYNPDFGTNVVESGRMSALRHADRKHEVRGNRFWLKNRRAFYDRGSTFLLFLFSE